MTVEQFLDTLEGKGLLSPDLMGKVRRQVDQSSKKITAESLARLLVKKRHLTKFQADHLLEETAPDTPVPSDSGLPPLETELSDQDEAPSPGGDDIKLAPLDGLDEDTGLTPLEDSSVSPQGLDPLESLEEPVEEPYEEELREITSESGVLDTTPPRDSDDLELQPSDESFISPSLEPLDDDTPLAEDLEDAGSLLEDDLAPMSIDSDSDELGELLDEASLVDSDDATEGPLTPAQKGLAGRFRSKKDLSKTTLKQSEWDSPLLLIGGGALILLVLVGGIAWFLLIRGTGDQIFAQAEENYRNGSYTQAINVYDEFLANYPNHASASPARVGRGLARLRQATQGTSNFERALSVAKEVLREIEDEQAFMDARDELSSLLPDIAEGLARQAKSDPNTAKVERTKQALGLVNNSNYVPSSLRPRARVEEIEAMLSLVLRDMERDSELQGALQKMRSQIAGGNVREAYATRKQLLKSYPDLETNESLAAVIRQLSQAELATVERVDKVRSALRKEPDSVVVASLALADRRGETAPLAAGHIALVQVRGAVYGLDASSGRLLWRRKVGFDQTVVPVRIDSKAGSDALLVDADRDELVRVATKTGQMSWRHPIAERFASPAVSGGRVLVATHSGILHAIDLDSGESTSHLKFRQNFRVAPAVHPDGVYAYQMGEHSSLYIVSLPDMQCKEVFYLGHAAGTVRVPPVFVLRNVIIAENRGTSASILHVLSTDAEGLSLQPVQQFRLNGHVLTPPLVFRRKLVVMTDLGEIKVFDIGTAGDPNPLSEVAQLVATGDRPMVRYPLVDRGNLWIADTRLSKYEVQFSSGKIGTQALDQIYEGDAFDYPLQLAGDVIIHVRSRQGHAGVTVSAMSVASGRQIWETHLAMPPAGEPVVDPKRREVTQATSSGAVYRLNYAAIQDRVRVYDRPLRVSDDDDASFLTHRIDLDNGRMAFSASGGHDRVLIYNPNDRNKPVHWMNVSGQLTCPPCPLGRGLLTPTDSGQVLWLDALTDRPLAAPFQPPLRSGQTFNWRMADVLQNNSEQAVLSDGYSKIYRVGVNESPERHLVALAQTTEIATAIVSPIAVLDQTVYAVDSEGVLLSFLLPDLQPGKRLPLEGQLTWGPKRVGLHVLVTTDRDELFCVDEAQNFVWRRPLSYGPLVGTPLADDNHYILTSSQGNQGVIWRIAADTGKEIAKVEIDQPLATGPVLFGSRLMVAGHDSTLLVIGKP